MPGYQIVYQKVIAERHPKTKNRYSSNFEISSKMKSLMIGSLMVRQSVRLA